ncbi:MAG: Hpt domain-containing protein [Gemmatimonadota bacterium]|nr:Hpt domain-containing protein [Gemmatimonadota bacterium]
MTQTLDVETLIRRQKTVRVDPVLESLVPRFLKNRKRDLIALYGALDDEDFETIQSLGHAMKGTGGAYGFDAISALGSEIEICGKDGNGRGAARWIRLLDGYLAKVKVLYEATESS